MNKEKIKEFIKKNKVAMGISGAVIVAGLVSLVGYGVHKANSSKNNTISSGIVARSEEENNTNSSGESKNNDNSNNVDENKQAIDNSTDENKVKNENKQENNTTSSENNKKDDAKNSEEKVSSNSKKSTDIAAYKLNEQSSSSTSKEDNNGTTSSNSSSHTHSWTPITKKVHHKEQGHYENVLVKKAWTEEVPVYEEQVRDICNTCNADLTGTNIAAHVKKHMMAGEDKGGHRTEVKTVKVGTKKVKHDAVYKKKWVVDKKAYDETITTGYKCSCGATK